MRFLRKRLTFANVAAALALLLAMGGGAFAATHYLITSTAQISPHVLSQLRGRRGPQGKTGKTGKRGKRGTPGGPRGKTGPEGPQGPPGLVGVEGRQGEEGKRGQRGPEGAPGPGALAPLPAGASESGVYAMNVGASPAKEVEYDAISLPVLLGAATTSFEYVPAETKGEHCQLPGTAPPGYLCIYSNFKQEAGVLPAPKVLDIEAGVPLEGSGTHGFVLAWKAAPAEAKDVGTYTITEK